MADVPLAPLPADLAGSVPRRLPGWLPPAGPFLASEALLLIVLAIGVFDVASAHRLPGSHEAAARLTAGLLLIAAALWIGWTAFAGRHRVRRLFAYGTPIVGRVIEVHRAGRSGQALAVAYEVPSLHGRHVAHIGARHLAAVGFHPGPGDTVFLVGDPAKRERRMVWGFAKKGAS